MTEQVLDILKLVLLALLYLFFARVLWAVWSEVRSPGNARAAGPIQSPMPDPNAPTVPAVRPAQRKRREVRPPAGRAGRAARLVVLEPKAARGQAYALEPRDHDRSRHQVHDHDPRRHVRVEPPRPRLRSRRTAGDRGSRVRPMAPTSTAARSPASSCSTPAIVCRSGTPSWRRSESRRQHRHVPNGGGDG